jgi:hypothetical protein
MQINGGSWKISCTTRRESKHLHSMSETTCRLKFQAHDMERVHFISYERIKSFVYVLQLTATKEQNNYTWSAVRCYFETVIIKVNDKRKQ